MASLSGVSRDEVIRSDDSGVVDGPEVSAASADGIGTSEVAKQRLLAIASGGGHWIELMRLKPAFDGFDVAYVSMFDNYAANLPNTRLYTVPDASRFNLRAFVPILWRSLWILARERPHAIVTTGSAPMLIFILVARLFGARTLWIDSVANSEHLSSSGRVAKRIAHHCIAQWEGVARDEAVGYWGRIV